MSAARSARRAGRARRASTSSGWPARAVAARDGAGGSRWAARAAARGLARARRLIARRGGAVGGAAIADAAAPAAAATTAPPLRRRLAGGCDARSARAPGRRAVPALVSGDRAGVAGWRVAQPRAGALFVAAWLRHRAWRALGAPRPARSRYVDVLAPPVALRARASARRARAARLPGALARRRRSLVAPAVQAGASSDGASDSGHLGALTPAQAARLSTFLRATRRARYELASATAAQGGAADRARRPARPDARHADSATPLDLAAGRFSKDVAQRRGPLRPDRRRAAAPHTATHARTGCGTGRTLGATSTAATSASGDLTPTRCIALIPASARAGTHEHRHARRLALDPHRRRRVDAARDAHRARSSARATRRSRSPTAAPRSTGRAPTASTSCCSTSRSGPGPDGYEVCRTLRERRNIGADHHAHRARQRGRHRARARGGRRRLRHQAVRPGRAAQPDPRGAAARRPARAERRCSPSARSSSTAARARCAATASRSSLTFSEFELLAALMAAPGPPVQPPGADARDLGRLAPTATRAAIDVHVRHLREKLEATPEQPELILTVRGAGYRLAA